MKALKSASLPIRELAKKMREPEEMAAKKARQAARQAYVEANFGDIVQPLKNEIANLRQIGTNWADIIADDCANLLKEIADYTLNYEASPSYYYDEDF